LDKFNDEEKKQMEKEIKAALEGWIDEFDYNNLLADSKVEGISLNQFNSGSSDIDFEDIDNYWIHSYLFNKNYLIFWIN
jgi:hypothetical protein